MEVCLNGKFVVEQEAKLPVSDHGFLFGDGVYDTLRTFNGHLFRPERHLDRLFSALKVVDIEMPWSKEEVMGWIHEGIERNGLAETRVRVTITRGSNKFRVIGVVQPTLLISFSSVTEIDGEYEEGVKVITYEAERALSQIKTTSMAPVMMARAEMEKQNVFEVLLVNQRGFVTEGSVTNVFMVEDGEILTPGEDMLEGTTRDMVLEWAEAKWPVRLENITVEDLQAADEVFVTNAVKGVVPVIEVDGKMIGEGKPGQITKELIEKFQEKVVGN